MEALVIIVNSNLIKELIRNTQIRPEAKLHTQPVNGYQLVTSIYARKNVHKG